MDKNLALFKLPTTDLGVEHVHWIDYRPVSQSDDGPLEFAVSGAGHQYVDLKNTKLFIKAKVLKSDGSPIPNIKKDPSGDLNADNINPEAFVGPVNLWLHSMFSQVQLLMQQKVISTSNLYPYRSYFESLIYPYERKLGQSELFYTDNPLNMDDTKPIIGKNEGFERRATKTARSREIDMEGPLHVDLCQQERYILNGVDFGLRFFQSQNAFRLMSDIGECKVKITDAVLKVCKVDVAASVLKTHQSIMTRQLTAKYPFERTEMRPFTVMNGVYSFKKSDMFQGEVPQKVVFGFVSAEAFNGHYQKNPFFLKHCNITQVGLEVDDVPVPQKPLDLSFSDEYCNSAAAFRALFEDHPDLSITRDMFDYGYTLFSITTRQGTPESLNTVQKGNCTLEIKFGQPLAENMILIVMAKFPDIMEIDEERQISG